MGPTVIKYWAKIVPKPDTILAPNTAVTMKNVN